MTPNTPATSASSSYDKQVYAVIPTRFIKGGRLALASQKLLLELLYRSRADDLFLLAKKAELADSFACIGKNNFQLDVLCQEIDTGTGRANSAVVKHSPACGESNERQTAPLFANQFARGLKHSSQMISDTRTV